MTGEPVAVEPARAAEARAGRCAERMVPPDALPALIAVLHDLANARVPHCVWKSNEHLAAALSGETDLDLLVARDSASLFHEVMARHGLKQLVPAAESTYPGMEHFLGLDGDSGRLFHLHVHFELVLGEQYVKNYRLPVEHALLCRTRVVHGVPVPEPELELAILTVRALLKYRARDVVKDVLAIRTPGIPAGIRTEIRWLQRQTDPQKIRAALTTDVVVSPDLVCEFLETVGQTRRSGFALLRLRARVRRQLGECKRRPRREAVVASLAAARRHRRRRRRQQSAPRMTPANGGLTVAVVGADGSGKSTVADATARWLSWKVETRIHYLGSKPPSRSSRLLYLVFRILRRSERAATNRLGPRPATQWIATLRDVSLAAHYLATGRQRAREYERGRRDAAAGRVVVFDRFPLERLGWLPQRRLLDGPQIAAALGDSMAGIARIMAAAEERMYQRFRLPDSLLVLDVDPGVAAARKPDHDAAVILEKSRVAGTLARLAGTGAVRGHRIDATRPFANVLLDVKTELWDAI